MLLSIIFLIIKYILNSLKKLLENVDSPNLMVKIAQTILKLSNFNHEATFNIFQVNYKNNKYIIINLYFSNFKKDIVDILIAWHIDPSQTDEVIESISELLVQLRPYWLKDFSFTITLLYQFIEDMESYLNVQLINIVLK